MNAGFGLYGSNPHWNLAQTPYARMTGQFVNVNPFAIPNLSSFVQPTFVDMNPYRAASGLSSAIPALPSFVGGAMNNPDVPIVQPQQLMGAGGHELNYGYSGGLPNYGGMGNFGGGYPTQQYQQPQYQQPQYQQPQYQQPQYPQQNSGGGNNFNLNALFNAIDKLFG